MKPRLDYADNLLSPFSVCHALIQDALHRCKDSQVATRITVTLMGVTMTDNTDRVYRVSVADTGFGVNESMLQDFYPYRTRGGTAEFHSSNLHWGNSCVCTPVKTCKVASVGVFCIVDYGVLFITTTCLTEQFIHNYEIKLGNNSAHHKVIRKCAQPKRNVFRGTESSVLVEGNFTALQHFIRDVCEKDVFVELCEEISNHRETQETHCLSICGRGEHVEEQASSIDRLHLGLAAYTLKYILKHTEESTYQGLWEIGKTETVIEGPNGTPWRMQVCFLLIAKGNHDEDKLSWEPDLQTQVVFFHNHSYCLHIPKIILRALSKVNWSKFGFRFKRICEGLPNRTTTTVIEWDQYPETIDRLDVVLHNLSDHSEDTKWKEEFQVVKETIDAALIDLKAKSPQLLSTPHESLVRTSIPVLADCISGIITSSDTKDFQEYCAGILRISPEKSSTLRHVVEAKLFAAFNKQNHQTEEDQECIFPDCEETLELLNKAEEMGGYDSNSEEVDIWNYL